MLKSLPEFFRCLLCPVVVAGSLAGHGAAADEPYCIEAQQIIAQTALTARVERHDNYDSFVESKPTANPLVVQSYHSSPVALPGGGEIPRVLSCKMKPAERLNAAFPDGQRGAPVAAGESDCQAVSRQWLQRLLEAIPAGERVLGANDVTVDEEALAFMGPMWLKPWPFVPASRTADGGLQLHSKALYVPFSWWIPMPERFKGQYYCHLVYPPYLEALLRGELALAD